MFHVKQENLKTYQDLLHKWQPKINLVSNNTLPDSWQRHFEDSLQVIELLPESAQNIVDIGSGAGFPGLVIAIERPDIHVTLIESDSKKCSFLKAVSRETKTSVTVLNERIENITLENAPDVIMARALASLDKLFDYCEKWVMQNPNVVFIFPKGQNYQSELAACQRNWEFHMDKKISKIDENSVILTFKDIKRISRK